MNDGEGHQRSFSVRPSERLLHRQDRVLASGWHQALGEGPVSHEAKWRSRPVSVARVAKARGSQLKAHAGFRGLLKPA